MLTANTSDYIWPYESKGSRASICFSLGGETLNLIRVYQLANTCHLIPQALIGSFLARNMQWEAVTAL